MHWPALLSSSVVHWTGKEDWLKKLCVNMWDLSGDLLSCPATPYNEATRIPLFAQCAASRERRQRI